MRKKRLVLNIWFVAGILAVILLSLLLLSVAKYGGAYVLRLQRVEFDFKNHKHKSDGEVVVIDKNGQERSLYHTPETGLLLHD